jgi:hypothetical protein
MGNGNAGWKTDAADRGVLGSGWQRTRPFCRRYTIHQKSGISGRDVHQRFFGHCVATAGKIVLLREALNVLAAADGMFPGGIADVLKQRPTP